MGGHEAELYHYCRGLHERYGYEVDVFVFDDKKKAMTDSKPMFLNKVFFAEDIGRIEKIGNLLFKSFLFGKWPLQSSLYYSKGNAERNVVMMLLL